jgi:hypothetical protein
VNACADAALRHTRARAEQATRDFAVWLKQHNEGLRAAAAADPAAPPLVPVAMLGMDIYSLFTSADEVSAQRVWSLHASECVASVCSGALVLLLVCVR